MTGVVVLEIQPTSLLVKRPVPSSFVMPAPREAVGRDTTNSFFVKRPMLYMYLGTLTLKFSFATTSADKVPVKYDRFRFDDDRAKSGSRPGLEFVSRSARIQITSLLDRSIVFFALLHICEKVHPRKRVVSGLREP